VKLGDRTYKNHLDGYDQMAMITGKGPSNRVTRSSTSARARSARCASTTTSTASSTSPRLARRKTHVDVPYLTNLRLDPFERTGWPNNGTKEGGAAVLRLVQVQFWRFVFVQQDVGKELPDLPRLPADAEGRELQPRRRESGDGTSRRPKRWRRHLLR
jgi:hypothetical protein